MPSIYLFKSLFVKIVVCFSLSLIIGSRASAAFYLKGAKPVVIPFHFINNLIVLTVNINGTALSFLLDSGVSETLLFSLENTELNLKNTESMRFQGLGGERSVEGVISQNNDFKVGSSFIDTNHTIYIIFNESFDISAHVGMPINGVIGYSFFANHTIHVDYIKRLITVYNSPEEIKQTKLRKYQKLPLVLEQNKPYITMDLMTDKNKYTQSKMLVDIGNSDALWVFPKALSKFSFQSTTITNDYLGRGFSGDIKGTRGRITGAQMGAYGMHKVTVAMPDSQSLRFAYPTKSRVGSVGTEILSRFDLIFDYTGGQFFFRANKHFNREFRFNMSGIEVVFDGARLTEEIVSNVSETPTYGTKSQNAGTVVFKSQSQTQYHYKLKPAYSINGVRKSSPAAQAGVLSGDKIVSINNNSIGDLSLADIYRLLSTKEGERVKIVVDRNGTLVKIQFYLTDPLKFIE